MSEALHSWLSSYLIDIGEEYGGSLTSVPQHTKRKKVQLVEVHVLECLGPARN